MSIYKMHSGSVRDPFQKLVFLMHSSIPFDVIKTIENLILFYLSLFFHIDLWLGIKYDSQV